MDLLVWPTVKAQLHLVEARKVKNVVGRERVRRNKDALRELRCLQEILGDLHAGDFGRAAPERRRAAEEAAQLWAQLQVRAKSGGRSVEEFCQASPSVRRYLLVSPATMGTLRCFQVKDSCASAPSTRAPSTAALQEGDAQSTAPTEGQLDVVCNAGIGGLEGSMTAPPWYAASFGFGAGMLGSGRMNSEQLNKLATELRDQLDQEHTSLMASIEEVQNLMEAEVADVGLLPSLVELEAFICQAKLGLSRMSVKSSPSSPSSISRKDSGGRCFFARKGRAEEKVNHDSMKHRQEGKDEEEDKHEEPEQQENETQTELLDLETPDDLASTDANHNLGCQSEVQNTGESCFPLETHDAGSGHVQAEAQPEASIWCMPASTVKNQGQRWADMASESEGESSPRAGPSSGTSAPRAGAECGRCHCLLGRESFSRRAWRQARGLGSEGLRAPSGASCLSCSQGRQILPVGAAITGRLKGKLR